jgi:hypothetical protein
VVGATTFSTSRFLAIDVQPNLLVPFRDGYITLSGGNDDVLAGGRRAELLGQVHLDGQDVALDLHFHILHARSPTVF